MKPKCITKKLLGNILTDFYVHLNLEIFQIAKHGREDVYFCVGVHCLAVYIAKSGYREGFKVHWLSNIT